MNGCNDGPTVHVPVLASEVLQWLKVRKRGVYVDCTVGDGGHAALIARELDGGRVIGLDRDPSSVETARRRLSEFSGVTVLHRNYGALAGVLHELGVETVDGILIDAGFSSAQLDDPARGFSFQADGPLDMRLDPTQSVTAAQFLASVNERELAETLRTYGDVGPVRRIARSILRRRDDHKLHTTRDLAEAVAEALDFVKGEPAEIRTVFQALRIAVNEEYRWLEACVRQGVDALASGGRLVALSYHSGEDRIVKNVFRELAHERRDEYPDGRVRTRLPACARVLTPKPVRPSEEEIRRNSRAHSAKLRVVERN